MEARTQRLRELEGELSPRHLKFARLVAEGTGSATDAYLEVYPGSSRDSAYSTAARLLGKARVREYIELVSGEAADTFVVNRTEVMQALWEMAERYGDDPKAANAVASALKTLMDHLTPKVPVRLEHSGPGGKPIQTDNSHRGLSPTMARAIMVNTLGLSDEQADRLLGKEAKEDADTTEGR